MSTPASIRGHPIHAMLVPIPIGLWLFSFACDLLHLFTADPIWAVIAFYALAGGEIAAAAAAVPGFIDFLSLRKRAAVRTAAIHMGLNVALVVLVAINLSLRWSTEAVAFPFALSALMVVMLGVSGWLGGHLVHVHAVTVDPAATGPREALAAEAGLADPRRALKR